MLLYIFTYIKLTIYKETILMSNETISYLITKINKDSWRKFRGTAILNGYNNAGECLKDLIKNYSEKKSND